MGKERKTHLVGCGRMSKITDNMFKEGLHIGGWFHIEHRRKGKLLSSEIVPNSLMNVFPAVASGLLGNTGAQTAFGWIALGTSNTAVAASQTTLVAETVVSGLARASATVSRTTVTQTNDTLSLSKTFTAAGSATIEEVGVFNASSSGVMACRALTTSKQLLSGDTIAITYTIQITIAFP